MSGTTSTPSEGDATPAAKAKPKTSRNERRRIKRNGNTVTKATIFKGEVTDMTGHVFQTHSERTKPNQFEETVNALRILASTEFKKDIRYLEPLFKDQSEPKIPLPVKPPATKIKQQDGSTVEVVDEVLMDLYHDKIGKYGEKEERLAATTMAMYHIVWGQCSVLLQSKLHTSVKRFEEEVVETYDVVKLLKVIKAVSYQVDQSVCIYDSIDEIQRQLFHYRQVDSNNITHLAKFKEMLEVLDHFGLKMFEDACCVDYEIEMDAMKPPATIPTKEGYLTKVKERRKAVCFLRRSNMRIYGNLMRELRDNYLHKMDIYPHNLDEAFALLQNHSSGKRSSFQKQPVAKDDKKDEPKDKEPDGMINGTQHVQWSAESTPSTPSTPSVGSEPEDYGPKTDPPTPVAGADGRVNPGVVCWKCRSTGHYADNCPESAENKVVDQANHHIQGATIEEATTSDDDTDDDSDSLVIGFTHTNILAPQSIDKDNILLDTGSNCSVFNNENYINNIRKSPVVLRAYTNGGHQDSTLVGRLPKFFDVFYNPKSLMNILSFAEVSAKYRVTMDSAEDDSIVVHLSDEKWHFKKMDSGLYLLLNNNKYNTKVTHYSDNMHTRSPIQGSNFLTLISENKAHFTKRELKRVELGRELYLHCNVPGQKKFIDLISANYFRNCPVTIHDVKNYYSIYGKERAELQGKGVRTRPLPISVRGHVPIPLPILDAHSSIQLSIDYLYVQGLPMLHSISGQSIISVPFTQCSKPNLTSKISLKV